MVSLQLRSFLAAMRSFAAAMFGVRKRSNAEQDQRRFGPVHAVAAGITMVAIFICIILAIVHLITGQTS